MVQAGAFPCSPSKSVAMQDPEDNTVHHKPRRIRAACLRCNAHKIKCTGDRPACRSCRISGNEKHCNYPIRTRKIPVLESEIASMQERISQLEQENQRLASKASLIDDCHQVSSTVSISCSSGSHTSENPPLNLFKLPGKRNESSCYFFAKELRSQLRQVSCLHEETNDRTNDSPRFFLDDQVLFTGNSDGLVILPDKDYAIELVRNVFKFFGREYGFFSIDEFEERLQNTYQDLFSQKSEWIAYLLVTLAVGEQYRNESSSGNKTPGIDFLKMALRLFKPHTEEPTLDTVRILLLIAFYSQGLNRRNCVFSYIGLAMSSAMVQGMHRKASDSALPERERQARRRVWWTGFVMDSLWASRLGLPPHVDIDEIDTDFPERSSDWTDDFEPLYIKANIKLSVKLANIQKDLYGPGSCLAFENLHSTTKEATELYTSKVRSHLMELKLFFDSLPACMQVVCMSLQNRSVANFHLRYHQAIIFAVRPLSLLALRSPDIASDSTDYVLSQCLESSKATIDILQDLWKSGWFSTFGFLEAQCCFSATLILVITKLSGRSVLPELRNAIALNSYMAKIGNITARENQRQLEELEKIVENINIKNKKAASVGAVISSHNVIAGSLSVEKEFVSVDSSKKSQKRVRDDSANQQMRLTDADIIISPSGDSSKGHKPQSPSLLFSKEYEHWEHDESVVSPDTWYNLCSNFQDWIG